jgi:hypothetical protein
MIDLLLDYNDQFPEVLKNLIVKIADGLSFNFAMDWISKLKQAVILEKDYSKIWPNFAIWLLTDKEHGVLQYAKTDEQRKSIQDVADLYQKSLTEIIPKEQWIIARDVADFVDSDHLCVLVAAFAAEVYIEDGFQDGNGAHAADITAGCYPISKKVHFMFQACKLLELLTEVN